jgi:membrane protein involved in colicin uptake
MKRSERMAKLKAERKLKMEQRRARMAAKKSGSTKRAFDDEAVKTKASEVYKKALRQGGGAFAAKKRREFLKDAQFKMDTRNTKKPTKTTGTTGSTGSTGSFVSTVTPKEKPKAPPKSTVTPNNKPPMDTRNQATVDDLREGITGGNDYSNTFTPGKKPTGTTGTTGSTGSTGSKPPGGGLTKIFAREIEVNRRRKEELAKRRARFAAAKLEEEKRDAQRLKARRERQAENRAERDRKAALLKEKQARNSARAAKNRAETATNIKNFFNENVLGPNGQLKSGGKVKKGYKKGCSVKKGYKSGGKVRGAGCVTKGVRPCKMR